MNDMGTGKSLELLEIRGPADIHLPYNIVSSLEGAVHT
jgi:hypothetical protein